MTGADQFVLHSYRALQAFDPSNTYLGYHESMGRWCAAHGIPSMAVSALSDVALKNAWIPIWSRTKGIDMHLHLVPPVCYTEHRVPQVCCIFDVPTGWEAAGFLDRCFNRCFNRWSSQAADHVVTISNYARDLLVESYGIRPEKISVIYPCTDFTVFHGGAKISAGLQASLDAAGCAHGFILGVMSRVIERKNPRAYVEVFDKLPQDLRSRRKLVLVGACSSADQLRPFVPADLLERTAASTVFLGKVSTPDLAGLYAQAGAVLFPSRYEGFGLPVIEALGCGALLITTNIPAIREATGGAIPLFDPDDLDGMAGWCTTLLTDTQRVEALRATTATWIQKFTYSAFAQRLSRVLAKVAGGRP